MSSDRPLAGVNVLDLMWVMAGPAASRVLADYGASVVHVESTKRIDTARTMAPFLTGLAGPLAGFAGFGSLASAISGFHNLTGWPDRPPAGPFGAYTDTIAPRFTAIAILAALDERRRTGRGQYIDQSQAVAARSPRARRSCTSAARSFRSLASNLWCTTYSTTT